MPVQPGFPGIASSAARPPFVHEDADTRCRELVLYPYDLTKMSDTTCADFLEAPTAVTHSALASRAFATFMFSNCIMEFENMNEIYYTTSMMIMA